MTEDQARTTANLVIAAAVVGAAYYVLRRPVLRRAAWQTARRWIAGPLAVWLLTEVRRAWDESGVVRRAAPQGNPARRLR